MATFAERSCLLTLLLLAGCGGTDSGQPDAGGSGSGSGGGSGSGSGSGGQECGKLRGTIRDFKIDHPDFEEILKGAGVVTGLVSPTIIPGGTPTLSPTAPAAGLISSAASFSQWYRDVADVNQSFPQDFLLTEISPGNFVYDNPSYYPIDNQGWGNEGNPHNYHFTTELHARFAYKGGEKFTFRGDDDVWVYVNGKLAIDIGGVHVAAEQQVDFDARAAEFGMTIGNDYPIDFFQAERHTSESNFRIETSIACFTDID